MENLKVKTGERVLPEAVSTEYDYIIFLRHLFAYEAAKREVPPGGRVLDLGCGEGYGTSLLSSISEQTTGLDVNPEAVEHASAKYGSGRCSFQVHDGTLPFPDRSFDAIVSFQVIEHVREDRHYVAEVRRALKDQGVFMVSTPNRAGRLKPGMKPWNRFHVREYYAEELEALLRTEFGQVEVRGVGATETIQNMELTRVRQNMKIASLDPLNLRNLLPEPVIPALIRVLRKVIYRDPGDKTNPDFKDKYGTRDFHFVKDQLQDSLDLFAVCRP